MAFTHILPNPTFQTLPSHIALIYNFHSLSFFGINPSFWSIAVEVQLYALYPVLLSLKQSLGWRKTLAGIAILEVALRLLDGFFLTKHGTTLPWVLRGSPFFYWFSWASGAFVADCFLENRKIRVAPFTICALAGVGVGCSLFKPLSGLPFLFFAILSSMAIVLFVSREESPASISSFWKRPLREAGVLSYSLYLWHQPLQFVVVYMIKHFLPLACEPLFLFSILVSSSFLIIPFSYLSYRYLELPSIAFGKRFYQPS